MCSDRTLEDAWAYQRASAIHSGLPTPPDTIDPETEAILRELLGADYPEGIAVVAAPPPATGAP